MTLAPTRVELALDACASPTIGTRRVGAYFVCGFSGYLAGLVLVMVLAYRLELGLAATAVLALAPPATLLVAIRISQRIFGHERIVFYEKALLAVAISALGAFAVGANVATMIDLVALGVGTFLAFGRIGCFRVGCCHGRPARRGVAYDFSHAAMGFPSRLIGVRVLPVQLVDGANSLIWVIAGTLALLDAAPAGVAACIYAVGYGVGRFVLEFLRGDPARPIAGGVTEAQWTALITLTSAAAWHPAAWSVAAASALGIAVLALLVARRAPRWNYPWLLAARHVDEVAEHVRRFSFHPGAPVTTEEGLRLSAARLPDGRLDVVVSSAARPLSVHLISVLASQLGRPWQAFHVAHGKTAGLVHLLLDETDRA
jgi:hypothetical protein